MIKKVTTSTPATAALVTYVERKQERSQFQTLASRGSVRRTRDVIKFSVLTLLTFSEPAPTEVILFAGVWLLTPDLERSVRRLSQLEV